MARALTNTFSGIRPGDVPGFIVAQLLGAAAATALFRWLVPALPAVAPEVLVPHASSEAITAEFRQSTHGECEQM